MMLLTPVYGGEKAKATPVRCHFVTEWRQDPVIGNVA